MNLPYPRIFVVINPASGQNEPILNVLNDVFHPAGVEWDIGITHKSGDATRLAKEAAARGVDLVAGYGGDGTQMEVANGLFGTGVPMAILPGGTGNAMAHELHVPINLKDAAQLIVSSRQRRAVDLVRTGDRLFMLRAYTGVSASEAASREEKDRLGQMAYIQASLKILTHLKQTPYRAIVDGEVIESKALIVFVLNAGSIGGVMGISLPQMGEVSSSDGYLDLYIVTKEIRPLRAISHHLFKVGESQAGVHHWRGKEITLQADSPQDIWIDGEIDGQTPFTATAIPQALEVVIPG
jgi:YegS/Rv2252/BmrU family lipid kinase